MNKAAFVTAVLTASMNASANAEHSPEHRFGLGIGMSYSESIYTGVDNTSEAFPLINLQYGHFYIRGLEAGYVLQNTDHFGLTISLAGDTLNGERDDSGLFSDMDDVDSGMNLKLSGNLKTDYGRLGLSFAQDISGEHDATEVTLSWGQSLSLDTIAIKPTMYATWMSDELVNHYYGVSSEQALPVRAQYEGDDGWRYGVRLAATYPLTQTWSVNGGVKAEWYSDEVTDSSIVEEDEVLSGFVGITYQF